jgi:hypothetical protein
MQYIVWQTTNGTIFPYQQGSNVSIPLIAQVANTAGPTLPVNHYTVVSGQLPPGITISGLSSSTVTVAGTIGAVSQQQTDLFTIRAWANAGSNTANNLYADATYGITVTLIPPAWQPSGNIANILSGNQQSNSFTNYSTDVTFTEYTANANVSIALVSGNIPKGMEVDVANASGIVGNTGQGQVNIVGVPYYSPGFANTASPGSNANTFVKSFDITLNLNDGTFQSDGTFLINVYAREFLTADMNLTSANANTGWFTFTVDSDYTQPGYPNSYPANSYTFPHNANNTFNFAADDSAVYAPWIITPPGNLGSTTSTNFFATGLDIVNPSNLPIRYLLANTNPNGTASTLPYGLALDPITGYIWGNSLAALTTGYNFTIYTVNADDPAYVSKSVSYSLLVNGKSPTTIIWNTPSNLGNIVNGGTSEFSVSATAQSGDALFYTLLSGDMPPGLILSENGLIIGRVLFDTPTPAKTYTFTIQATGDTTGITGSAVFNITVLFANPVPFNNLYCQAYFENQKRLLVQEILQDYNSMPFSQIYRFSDPNFGINNRLNFLQAVNVNVATDAAYAAALDYNHYRKHVTIGPFTYAQALNLDGTIKYEVVYCPIIDDLVNPKNQSPALSDPVPFPPAVYDGNDYSTVYPNSLDNMRRRVYDSLQQANYELPLWMGSVQKNNQVLGFTAAWVVCYAQPGYGEAISYRLNQTWGSVLYELDFTIDRYELDNALTYRYQTSGSNVWTWANAISVNSPVLSISNNILFANVYFDSLTPELNIGDTLSWVDTNNSVFTTNIIDIGANTPVTNITLVNAGSGYSNIIPPSITIQSPVQGGGVQALANVTVNADGTINSNIILTSTGLGYHTPPRVTISNPPNSMGQTATATATISVSPVTGFTVISSGDSYKKTPNVYIQPPTPDPLIPGFNPAAATATAAAVVVPSNVNPAYNDVVSFVYLTNPGGGGKSYTSAPVVTVDKSLYGNTAVIGATINYQIAVGNVTGWANLLANSQPASLWLYNQYVAGNEFNKYYLFPRVNVLQ